MPTLERAQKVKNGMNRIWGGYSIYWDKLFNCYRVMRKDSPSLVLNGKNYKAIC